ncbi:MAG: hypothetical protein LQ350_005689 [Teloschistes chrysophthalmus]|nr:MAG: hypothetical protein LQ350_005689 [Niorma chrysophthalma]
MTTTSHAPSSSVLVVPTTQNTAPVLSFNCLYTRDLRRKAKRWQDGFLRFHTFNKRVMVYDIVRNFIGDTHWRESQAIQDGEELELEKGVLIQVGEEVERTETDLTELLEKRKAKPVPSGEGSSAQNGPGITPITSRNQPSDTIHRAVDRSILAQASQLRPKSLNALLGKHRGPVGRASLPTKSPADQRREKENHYVDGDARSPKRRRLQSPKDSTPSGPSTKARGMQPVLQPPKDFRAPNPTSRMPQAVESQAPVITKEIPSVSRRPGPPKGRQDVQLHQPPKVGSLGQHGQGQPPHETSDAILDIEDHARPRERRQRSHPELHVPSNPARQEQSRHVEPSERPTTTVLTSDTLQRNGKLSRQVVSVESDTRNTSLDNESRLKNLLRIASAKPRRKLIYRDLLPQKAPLPANQARSSKGVSNRSSHQATSLSRQAKERRKPLLDDFHEAQRGRLQERLSRCNRTSDIASKRTTLLEDEEVDENLGTENKASSPKGNDDSDFLETLFLTQSSSDECVPNAEETATKAISPLENHTETETNIDAEVEPSPPSRAHPPLANSDVAPSNDPQNEQQPPAAQPNETVNTPPSRHDANAQEKEQAPSTPPQPTHTSLDPDNPPPQDPDHQPATKQQNNTVDNPAPRQNHAIIKAALPPPPQHRPFRPFQRSISDISSAYAALKPNENRPTFTKPSCLRRHLSAEETTTENPNPTNSAFSVPAKPTPPIRSTTLYASSNNKKMGIGAVGGQVADPWSREAFDLFGFDGCDRRVGTENGLEGAAGREGRGPRGVGGGGEGEGEGEMRYVLDDIMAESQGFV